MAEPIDHQDLPIWVPGRILGSSDSLGWKGVATRSYRYRGQDVEIPPMRDFLLVAYCVGVTPMQRRFDGKWSRATCGPGAVSLLTRSQRSHWHWQEDLDVAHVYLSPELVSEVAQEVTGRTVEDVSLRDILRTDDPDILTLMSFIAREARDNAPGGPLYAESVARQLIILLLRQYASVRMIPFARRGELTMAQRRRVVEYIDAHLDERLELGEMASQAGQGACSFARHFKRSMGLAPHAYVIERRLQRAMGLVRDSALSLKEIAPRCGFADQAHLTRLFVRRFKLTPSATRRNRHLRPDDGD